MTFLLRSARKLYFLPLFLSISLLLNSCSSTKEIIPDTLFGASDKSVPTADSKDSAPKIEREFRAAWIATVANINWPSSRNLTTEQQKAEALALLDMLQRSRYNAVIFQARPQADALYNSELEPWSYYLTGTQGKAPEPYYDPLEFWIEEAHKRNLELHVWINPYRAHHTAGGDIGEKSVVNTMPNAVVALESGFYWFNPTSEETQAHTKQVIMDIVKRYDIDGVHFDDYFFPYPSYNNDIDFPDFDTWSSYKNNGGKLGRADWRRQAVNNFVKDIYSAIKKEKPYLKFGISPFGIWRPGNPPSITGMDQYEDLYADAKKWLNEGWVDYLAPQLYWPINQMEQSFPVLLGWWNAENHKHRYVWPGINIGLYDGEKRIDEFLNQIMITRGMNPAAPGTIHWNLGALVQSDSMQTALSALPYAKQALVPPLDATHQRKPKHPDVRINYGEDRLTIHIEADAADISNWVVYSRFTNYWTATVLPRTGQSYTLPYYKIEPGTGDSGFELDTISLLDEIRVTQINRFGTESEALVINPCNFDCYMPQKEN